VVEDDVFAEYGVFTLQAHFSSVVALELGRPARGELLRAGRGGATFRSAGFDRTVHVRTELWPSQPPGLPPGPSPDRPWDAVAAGTADIDTTELRLASATAGVSDRPVRLPAAGRYRVEAAVSEDTATGPASSDADPEPEPSEHWLIRLWPLTGTARPQ
jgi:hypothetical protein